MSKKLIIGAAIGALMTSAALAQAPPAPPSSGSTPPAASSPAAPPAAKQAQPSAAPSAGKAAMVSSQKPDQWLASKFRGTDVLGADNLKIGSVSDILFDKTGKIEAYVISVGGFLGMGAKEVALAPSSFDVMPGKDGNADQIKVSMTKDELSNAQNFARYEPPRPRPTTTGSGPRPAGSPPSTR